MKKREKFTVIIHFFVIYLPAQKSFGFLPQTT